jgi:hypothetical protein
MQESDDNQNDSSLPVLDGNGASAAKQTCSKCSKRKGHSDFYFRDGKPDRICKDCKKSAQKDNYRKKAFAENVDSVVSSLFNKVLDYKITRAKIVNDELGRLLEECETQLKQNRLPMAS